MSDCSLSISFCASILKMNEMRSSLGISMMFLILWNSSWSWIYWVMCIVEEFLSYFLRNFISKNEDGILSFTIVLFLKSLWQTFYFIRLLFVSSVSPTWFIYYWNYYRNLSLTKSTMLPFSMIIIDSSRLSKIIRYWIFSLILSNM